MSSFTCVQEALLHMCRSIQLFTGEVKLMQEKTPEQKIDDIINAVIYKFRVSFGKYTGDLPLPYF